MIKKIEVEKAIGMVLAHDVTKITPGHFKGPVFRKGHVIAPEDAPELLAVGKEHVYVLELEPGEVHEEEAALRIARALAGPELELTPPQEGRVDLKAQHPGLLYINVPMLDRINCLEEVIVATVHQHTLCHTGMVVAGTRIIPLFTTEARVREVEALCQEAGKVLKLVPLAQKGIGVVITGNEIFKGRNQDKFGDIIQQKVEALGSTLTRRLLAPDDAHLIAQAIARLREEGNEVILACGGMSVDPDDVTREGIARTGARIVRYGAPVLPGSMFLYALWDDLPILGVPACVIHEPATVLDLLLPRILAGEELTSQEIGKLGHGGLCLHCPECVFPVCPFGRG